MEIKWMEIRFVMCVKCKTVVAHEHGKLKDGTKATECMKCERLSLFDKNNIVVKVIDRSGDVP
ncbi:MAG TPA: hypothetical protein VJL60_03060 [Gammaproteobacteria bacterium]|nr:hypothetical protein [Gammaproteobacteria bacterium]